MVEFGFILGDEIMSEHASTVQTPDRWKDEHIADFWDWASRQPGVEEKYFTKIYGPVLEKMFPSWVVSQGEVLDYGCGRGDFTARLLDMSSYKVSIADTSPGSIEDVVKRCGDSPNFDRSAVLKDLPCELDGDSFDAVTFFETIEHLREEAIPPTLKEIHRLLRKGGRLILTTPNDESLQAGHVYCPFCSSEFHRMQHFSTFDTKKMRSLLEDAGFNVVRCEGVDLHGYGGLKSKLASWLRYDLRGIKKPNLLAVAEKA